jgi:hypothetical protein
MVLAAASTLAIPVAVDIREANSGRPGHLDDHASGW